MNSNREDRAGDELARLEYSKVVKSAALRDIRLLSSSFVVEEEYFEGREQGDTEDEKLSFAYGCERPMVSYDAEDGGLIGQFEWNANAKREDTVVLKISGTYVIVYDCDEGLDDDATRRFVERVGRFAIFPYFRNLVGVYSTASAIEVPILPILKE